MKLIKPKKLTTRNLAKFLIIFTIVFGGVFSFQYFAKAITITNITPNTGSVVGGQEVTITGDFAIDSTPTTLQQITQDYCTNEMSVFPTGDSKPDTITLADIRNNQEYRIRKMADNKCWMIDNLKLELKNGMTLTPTDTNVEKDTTIYFTEDGTKDGIALGGMTGNFTTSNYYDTIDGTNSSVSPNLDAWRQNDPSDVTNCHDNIGNTGNGGVTYNQASLTGCGYLYNFYTATAGTGDSTKIAQYDTAESSICPAGWRLPTGKAANIGTDGDFQNLNTIYGGTGVYPDNTTQPLVTDLWLSAGAWQGTLSGVYNFQYGSVGVVDYHWSSLVSTAGFAYALGFNSTIGWPGSMAGGNRAYGHAVRCLVDEDHVPTPVVPVVSFGGAMATVVGYSDTEITIIAPAHSAGKVDVIVTRGSQTFTLTDAYEYFNVPDVPNTGVSKTSATTTAVQSGLAALIIITIGTAIFTIKQRKAKR